MAEGRDQVLGRQRPLDDGLCHDGVGMGERRELSDAVLDREQAAREDVVHVRQDDEQE
ncbi:hypothetical protein ACFQL4_02805 [Halosimplex aquaticum]